VLKPLAHFSQPLAKSRLPPKRQIAKVTAQEIAATETGPVLHARDSQKKSERIEVLTWRQIWSDLGGPNTLSWQAMFIFVPIACSAATIYDHNRLSGNDNAWVIIGLAGYLVALIAMILLRSFASVNRYRPSLVIFVGIILVGVSRGIVVYEVGNALGMIPAYELAFRALGSAFLFIWVLVGANVVVTAANKYREATEKLTTELAYLAGAKNSLSRNIETVRVQLQSRINSVLAPSLNTLIEKLKSATSQPVKASVADLQEIIENVVRPLSHRVSKPTFLVEDEPKPLTTKPSTFLEVLRGNVALGDVVLPTFVATATVLAALPSAIITVPILTTVAVAGLGWLSVFVFMFVARYVLRDLFVPVWLASLLAAVLPLLAGSGAILGGWGRPVDLSRTTGLEFFSLASSFSFAAFWFQVLELKRAQSLKQLAQVAEEQRQLLSAMRQEIWVLQRHLASTLHGPVQAALFSAVFKINQSEQIKPEQVDELVSNLQAAMEQLGNSPGLDEREFKVVWNELCDFWRGVCEVECGFESRVVAKIADNHQALSCAAEVMREAVNNAVRHAEASKVSVGLAIDGNLLLVSVKNNGAPLPEQRTEGFGSELIKDVTHSSELVALEPNEGNWVTELRASVVLSQALS